MEKAACESELLYSKPSQLFITIITVSLLPNQPTQYGPKHPELCYDHVVDVLWSVT